MVYDARGGAGPETRPAAVLIPPSSFHDRGHRAEITRRRRRHPGDGTGATGRPGGPVRGGPGAVRPAVVRLSGGRGPDLVPEAGAAAHPAGQRVALAVPG